MLASDDKPWFEVYEAAMLELDPQKLPERIVVAKATLLLTHPMQERVPGRIWLHRPHRTLPIVDYPKSPVCG